MDDAALAEVIRRAQTGDASAFDRLVDAFGHRITGFFYRLTGSRDDAEDLVQEVFVRLVRMIAAYRHEDRFEAWLFRIAANLARDRVRKVRRAPKFVSASGAGESNEDANPRSLDGMEGASEPVDAGLVGGEQVDALNAALARLPIGEREVIMLRHFSQMSFREIAEIMEMPLGTALARSHRGLARLREMMSEGPATQKQRPRAEARAKG
ncbi:MAG: sigma-70 family RNA polymerase sigma factor [Phycisphaerales bacterium]|nr:sigma-70 family RNA polymerase sigma factor [Phycisphaerales bacterium]